MKNRIKMKYNSELPLQKDKANLFLEVITGVMVFLFSVTLAGFLMVNSVTENWNRGISGSLTVQIMPSSETLNTEENLLRINKVISFFEGRAGVEKVLLVSDEQMQRLMGPWLGKGVDIQKLPVPKLLDVRLGNSKGFDFDAVAAELKSVAPYASMDNHQIWLHRLITFADSMQKFALLILGMVLLASVLSIYYATSTSLGIHKDIIEILHIMGATDDYVARQYAFRGFWIGLFSGIGGTLLALAAFLLLHRLAAGLNQGLIGDISLGGKGWLMIVSLPMWAALFSTVTAYFTVRRTLGKIM